MANEATEVVEKAGIPQLDFSSFPNQIFWLVVFIVALYFIVGRVVIPRIRGIIDQRGRRIEDDFDEAGKLVAEAQKIEQENLKTIEAARRKAEAISTESRNRILERRNEAFEIANGKIAGIVTESERRIKQIRSRAQDDIAEISNVVAIEIVSNAFPDRNHSDLVRSVVKSKLEG